MNLHRAVRGITLIELLVIFVIVWILAAILFPVFAAARNKARDNAAYFTPRNGTTNPS